MREVRLSASEIRLVKAAALTKDVGTLFGVLRRDRGSCDAGNPIQAVAVRCTLFQVG